MKTTGTGKYLYAFKAVSAGLVTGQLIGTVHVYLSNKELYHSMQMVQQAGYLAVPNEQVWASLQGFGAAFWGGLFFALSIGSGLSIVGLICAWTWDRLFGRRNAFLFLYLLLWLTGIGFVNANGFSPLSTAYLVVIPPLVFRAALYWMVPGQEQGDRIHTMIYLAVPVLLLLLFVPLAKKSIFLDIRDMILFNNPIGRKINDFYYDYTLYAAQAFKSLEQKTIRTCRLKLAENESHRPAIKNIFLSRDYLVLDGEGPVDLEVSEQGGSLVFKHRDEAILTITLREFSANSEAALEGFSRETDRFGPLRLVAFGSMAVGSPLCLYIMLHGIFFIILVKIMGQRRAGIAALLLCMAAGLGIALPLYGMKTQNFGADTVNAALVSSRWQERVAALRYLEQNGLPAEAIIAKAENSLKSPYIAERYWYVRAVGSGTSAEAVRVLLAALDDPNINVVCMAFYGLGRQKSRSALEEVKRRVEINNNWYQQWYGYRALRALGWHQGL